MINEIASASASQTAPATGGGLGGALSNGLGQDAFMKLLVTQLQHQDPTAPKDDSQMLAQLAQFTSLERLSSIDNTLANLTALFTSFQKEA